MTLVEVLAALAIVGVVLTTLLAARGRYIHQWAIAQRKSQAIAAADRLLADWWALPIEDFPREASGTTSDAAHLPWRTEITQRSVIGLSELEVVRLSIGEANAANSSPLVSVELVIPAVVEPKVRNK
jgi:hypothetical protein